MIESVVQTLLEFSSSLGYWGVFLLMTIESSFIPFPSEIIIPPAAYLAFKGEMSIYLVVLFGILGSLVGALINYFLARSLGRLLVYELVEHKFAKYLLLSKKKVEKAEKYFLEYGGVSTFIGRLFPAVRQLISLPAGFVKMSLKSFLFYTTLGAGIWVTILAAAGYYFGEHQEKLLGYLGAFKHYLYAILGIAIIVVILIIVKHYNKKKYGK
jgi:membrane protein DedA with SNARE-associated domain